MKEIRQRLFLSLVASLTLGLAPFLPQPHLVGKLRWLWGGAKGMEIADYLDLIMHGAPWLAFFYFFTRWLSHTVKEKVAEGKKFGK